MSPVRTDVALGLDHARDLGVVELWDRSLKRSRHRRRIAEINRRSRRRRKGTSVAVSAALAAGPVMPTATAIADSGTGASSSGQVNPGTNDALAESAHHVVLRYGNTGRLVAAAQMRLNAVLPLHHLVVDGIYGPLTRAAVEDFQSRHDLGSSGRVDTRTWADLFNAPVLTLADSGSSESAASGPATEVSTRVGDGRHSPGESAAAAAASVSAARASASQSSASGSRNSGSGTAAGNAQTTNTSSSGSGSASGSGGGGGNNSVAVVTPSKPSSQSVSYVLSNGVALPLPRGYLTGGSVDQGVDYAAPGGTPLYAMGDGVIIGAGISGFGPNAPILKITSGPLKGMVIYYGHAGANSVHVGQHVTAGQQISQVGYGIVGISTGPHLEVGFYPPGAMGAGSKMLSLINSLLGQHSSGRVWGTKMAKAVTVKTAVDHASVARSTSTPASTVRVSDTSQSTPASTAHSSARIDRLLVAQRGGTDDVGAKAGRDDSDPGCVEPDRGGDTGCADRSRGEQRCPGGEQRCPSGEQRCPGGEQQCSGGEQQCPGGEQRCPGGEQWCPGRQAAVPRRRAAARRRAVRHRARIRPRAPRHRRRRRRAPATRAPGQAARPAL